MIILYEVEYNNDRDSYYYIDYIRLGNSVLTHIRGGLGVYLVV